MSPVGENSKSHESAGGSAANETYEQHQRLCRCSFDPTYQETCDHCSDDCTFRPSVERPAANSATESLREVTVNGIRFFNSDDVERWHRQLLGRSNLADVLEEESSALREFVEKTYVRFKERMPDEWLSEAETLLATTGRDDD